jgi:hypothetical protein
LTLSNDDRLIKQSHKNKNKEKLILSKGSSSELLTHQAHTSLALAAWL